jgi:hypothetical protein
MIHSFLEALPVQTSWAAAFLSQAVGARGGLEPLVSIDYLLSRANNTDRTSFVNP